jgi:drug/metabolite transporter (DMT)-like permease
MGKSIITEEESQSKIRAILLALLAAALYGISSPVSKLLVEKIPPTMMAGLLYLGAGFGMFLVQGIKIVRKNNHSEAKMTKKELPFIIGMVLLDIGAPILLMFGLTLTTSANASLLNNFEIAATAVIALFIFKETVGKRMWIAITLITVSSIVLSVEDHGSFTFSFGSVLVLLACVCWGFENNCTRMLSFKDPLKVVVIKGFGSGLGSLLISVALGDLSGNILYIAITLILGFVAYGLSIYCYIRAQRTLGAARTSTFYAAAPFIGVLISWLIFRDGLTGTFLAAFAIMLTGTYFAVTEEHNHLHAHLAITHEHKHNHNDGIHNHVHIPEVSGEHCHVHTHEAIVHKHPHSHELHHKHSHSAIHTKIRQDKE